MPPPGALIVNVNVPVPPGDTADWSSVAGRFGPSQSDATKTLQRSRGPLVARCTGWLPPLRQVAVPVLTTVTVTVARCAGRNRVRSIGPPSSAVIVTPESDAR